MGRFTGADKLADHPNQVDKSPFAYTWDNPIKLTDPDGNCPNCRELFLALDQALTGGKIGRALETGLGFVPIVGQILDASAAATGEELFTGEQLSGGERALALVPGKIEKVAGAASGIVKNADEVAEVATSVEKSDAKSLLRQGRSGRQQKLRDLANDTKTSSADRGWIKQDINQINRGKRQNIRTPPGKQLAHERGREAAKGYPYKYSNLQDKDLHRRQHRHDNYGKDNKERPIN